jgi:hypothetical protein
MRDIELYTAVLGIAPPWMIKDASLDVAQQKVEISVTHEGPATCPSAAELQRSTIRGRGAGGI